MRYRRQAVCHKIVVPLATAIAMVMTTGLYAQPSPALATRPTWVIGDTWTYRDQYGKNTDETVTGIAEDHWVVMTRTGSELHHVVLVNFDFSPNNYARFSWPLELKKQWTFQFTGQANNGVAGQNRYVTTSTVEAYESVNVPAGTFDAFRVRGLQCNASQQNTCGEFVVWYAPQAKRWVKIFFQSRTWWVFGGKSIELVAYHVQ